MDAGQAPEASGERRKSPGFFALDVHQFERIREAGLGIEEAAAYLCLLVSTDQGNVVSSGGINSIMTYSGLSRGEAKKAVQRLEARQLLKCVEVERKRARTVPRHVLPVHDARRPLAGKESEVVEAIRAGRQPSGTSEANAAQRAQAKGYVERRADGWAVVEHGNEVAFIPNSFVRVAEGASPLARLVNNGELGPIMLAAELYHLQDLMNERGVPAEIVRSYFRTAGTLRLDHHNLHLLMAGRSHTDDKTGKESSVSSACEPPRLRDYNQEVFWPALRALEAAHVVEWAIYSANGKPSGKYGYNRPQRPLGVLRNGKQVLHTPESRPAFLTYLLLCATKDWMDHLMRPLPALIAEWRQTSPVIVLENVSVSHVEGIGILRMAHRAATDNTSVWYRNLCQECDQALFFVEQTMQAAFPQVAAMAREVCDRQASGKLFQ